MRTPHYSGHFNGTFVCVRVSNSMYRCACMYTSMHFVYIYVHVRLYSGTFILNSDTSINHFHLSQMPHLCT